MENSTATPTNTKTTPKKRRHSEYHDPDYTFGHENSDTEDKVKKRFKREQKEDKDHTLLDKGQKTSKTYGSQIKRFEEIVRNEFQKELTLKENQLSAIDTRLLEARQLLDKLRYHVVSEYYKKQQVPLTAADVSKVRSSDTLFGNGIEHDGVQLPLHPAVRKIVGKRPTPIKLHLPERTAATLAKQTIRLRNPANRRAERRRQQKIRDHGIVTDHTEEEKNEGPSNSKQPTSEDPPCTSKQAYNHQNEANISVSSLNSSRLNNKNKFYFVIGNTSKYLGGIDSNDKKGQLLAYKWLVYVQGKNLPQPPEAYLKKVRFQLHQSYRPNDIVDVHSPPFQLTRRGWGEFPMRIQLYFQEHLLQKPVQLMHNIVLDKTMCGLHTMGGETIVEVWLHADIPTRPLPTTAPLIIKREPSLSMSGLSSFLSEDSSKPRTISITQNKEDIDDNLFACINKIELSDDIDHIEPTVIVSEPIKLISPKKIQPPRVTSIKSELNRKAINEICESSPQIMENNVFINGKSSNKTPQAMVAQLRNENRKMPVKNVVFQKAGKLYIIDPVQSKLKQAAKQQSLLKPQLSLLKQPVQRLTKRCHILKCFQHDHGYANMNSDVEPLPLALPLSQRLSLEQQFSSIHFQGMRSAVDFLLRRLPLVNAVRSEFPFGSHTHATFQMQSALRQRFYEFSRGRALLRCMRQHLRLQFLHASGKENFWSTREIVAYARLHGYTPLLKTLCVNRQITASGALPLSKRIQQELKEDSQTQLLAYCSLSSRTCLDTWIRKQLERLHCRQQKLEDQETVDVISIDSPCSRKTQRTQTSLNSSLCKQTLYLPPPDELDSAAQLVRDMCKDMGIVLETEQSVPGVSQSLALTLLAHVLRMFIEKLVRRTVATKLQRHHPNTIQTLPPSATNLELSLLPHDIAGVIARSAELDFLGNYYLGVKHLDNQTKL